MKRLLLLMAVAYAVMAQGPVVRSAGGCVAASASGTTYTFNCTVDPGAYVAHQAYYVTADIANTAAATGNINSHGAISIVKNVGGANTALSANDIRAGSELTLVYNGTNFQCSAGCDGIGGGAPLASPGFTGAVSITDSALNTTSTDGLFIVNSTAALTAQQQISPRLRFTSSGWGTTGSASQVGDIVLENLPIRDTTVDPMLRITYQEAGGGYVQVANIGPIVSFHNLYGLYLGSNTPSLTNYAMFSNNTDLTINASGAAGVTHFKNNNSADKMSLDGNGNLTVTGGVTITGKLSVPIMQSTGTKFTASGCSVASTVGGGTAGKFTVAAGVCSGVTVTLPATTNGFSCHANDETTPANVWTQVAGGSTTTAVLAGTSAGTDTINYFCVGY